jgi:glycosyltransferase involved in cell wall biosynthesis
MSKLPSAAILFKPVIGKGGAQTYISRLANWFDAPVFCLYDDRPETDWEDAETIEFGEKITIPYTDRSVSNGLLEKLQYAFWTPPSGYDVVLSSGFKTEVTQHRPEQVRIHLAHGFHRGAFAVPPHDTFSDIYPVKVLQQLNRLWIRHEQISSLKSIDILITNSEFTSNMLERYYSVSTDYVINPPVNTSSYYNSRPADENFYLFLGRIDEVKGIEQIVESFERLPYRLVVAGDGSLRDPLSEKAADNVEFVGYVSEAQKRELLATCSGFIQNSIIEDFGITTVEALASGAPVIAVNRQNNPYLITDGKTGFLFNPAETTDNLVEAIEQAENHDWNHTAIQEAAEPYSAENCKKQWNNVLFSASRRGE